MRSFQPAIILCRFYCIDQGLAMGFMCTLYKTHCELFSWLHDPEEAGLYAISDGNAVASTPANTRLIFASSLQRMEQIIPWDFVTLRYMMNLHMCHIHICHSLLAEQEQSVLQEMSCISQSSTCQECQGEYETGCIEKTGQTRNDPSCAMSPTFLRNFS